MSSVCGGYGIEGSIAPNAGLAQVRVKQGILYEVGEAKMVRWFFGLMAVLCVAATVCAREEGGLVARYTFDEGQSNLIKDSSGKENHAQ